MTVPGHSRVHSDQPDGREYRELLLRLIDGVKDDMVALRESIVALRDEVGDTEKIARAAFLRIEQAEVKIAKLETQTQDSTLSIVEIKAVSKTAGMIAGAITGVLGAVLTGFLMRILNLGG
jgi:hypothetical protein